RTMRNAGDNRGIAALSILTLPCRGLLAGLATASIMAAPAGATSGRSAEADRLASLAPPDEEAPGVLSRDTALITLCRRLVALRTELSALFRVRHTIEDEYRTDTQFKAIKAEREAVMERLGALDSIPPATWRG